MRKELDEKLCKDYPEVFRQRHLSMRETLMCWGFECGEGWYPLIDTLCQLLSSNVIALKRTIKYIEEMLASTEKADWNDWAKGYYTPEKLAEKYAKLEEAKKEVPSAVQVKEKFGTLRFYVDRSTEQQQAYITFAEVMSGKICETCGTTKDVYQTEGWVRTTCSSCDEQRAQEAFAAN